MMQKRQDTCFPIAKYICTYEEREKADPGKDSQHT